MQSLPELDSDTGINQCPELTGNEGTLSTPSQCTSSSSEGGKSGSSRYVSFLDEDGEIGVW